MNAYRLIQAETPANRLITQILSHTYFPRFLTLFMVPTTVFQMLTNIRMLGTMNVTRWDDTFCKLCWSSLAELFLHPIRKVKTPIPYSKYQLYRF